MRTLDDIIPPSRRKETEQMHDGDRYRPPQRESSRFSFTTFIAIALVIITSIGVLFYFSTSMVEITPNAVTVAVQGSFTASAQGTSTLPFQVITAQKTASQSIKSSGTKSVQSSASGTVTIYNTQSKTQKLVANTRFATSAGLIFRIRNTVIVPAGSTSKPGTISAKIYADKPGDTYNVGPTSFTVPGFAGTPQASRVYARSTSAMTGGASGTIPVVDAAEETQARQTLSASLSADLLANIQAQVPKGYVLLKGASATTIENAHITPSATTGMADIKETATVTAVVFPNESLASAIASSVPSIEYQGEPLSLKSTDTLEFVAETALPNADTKSFTFTLAGNAPLVYTINPARIAAAIAGESRSKAEVSLTNYPEVKRAVLILRPFWRQSFPEDPAGISIVVQDEAY